MIYKIKTVSSCDVNWDEVEKAHIDIYKWSKAYTPVTYAQLVSVDGKGLKLKMTCFETNPYAIAEGFYSEVWKDSCMEFFFGFIKNGVYMNIEMNSTGAFLIGVGDNRHGRRKLNEITELPHEEARIYDDRWETEIYVPLETLTSVFGGVSLKPGTVLYANFYKCGDYTEIPHYGTWSEIGLDGPDYHRPEFFSELVIV
jgi:hypothetical protein